MLKFNNALMSNKHKKVIFYLFKSLIHHVILQTSLPKIDQVSENVKSHGVWLRLVYLIVLKVYGWFTVNPEKI